MLKALDTLLKGYKGFKPNAYNVHKFKVILKIKRSKLPHYVEVSQRYSVLKALNTFLKGYKGFKPNAYNVQKSKVILKIEKVEVTTLCRS